ncbi:MAG: type I-B CRISPR-associated endonuclease Cas1 [Actinobacteria bacterium]|nr:type I-B CRISPR-associated endonuclease Cas1 [Actinomycetota bacterium]
MKKSIYLFSNGDLKRKDNTLYVELENGVKKYIPIENTKEIFVFGEVTINKKFLDFASQNEIIVHYFNYFGFYSGTFYPREHYNSGYMILNQARYYLDQAERLKLARSFVIGAVSNILKILKYYNRRGKILDSVISRIEENGNKVSDTNSIDELMAIEGNIKQLYYGAFDVILENTDFTFDKRSKRPPKNEINAVISFSNSLIYTICLSEIYHTHLDPRIGFLHTTNFRRFSLNLDIAEIFKPVIGDRTILALFNKNQFDSKCFENQLNGFALNDKGRRLFITELEKRLSSTICHHSLNRQVSYRRLIRLELYKLEKHLLGEAEYKPFVMDW